MRRALVLGLVFLVATLTQSVRANTYRLDDSLSHTVPPNLQMEWLPLRPGQAFGTGMQAWVRVNVRIDTRQWIGHSGRIYMVLSRDEASSIEATWTTQGRLQAGRLVSGERALVYAGVIPDVTLEDQLLVRLRATPDWVSSSRRLNFHFELDAD